MRVPTLKLATRIGVAAVALVLAQLAGTASPASAALIGTTLGSQESYTRPEPTTVHEYNFTTGHNFWSVVAIRSQGTTDLNLATYDSSDAFLNLSFQGIDGDGFGTIDFVATDSNGGRRAYPAGYNARVTRPVGGPSTWNYTTEFADPGKVLVPGPNTVELATPNRVVNVRDVWVPKNTTVTITAQPTVPGQYAEIFLMGSTSGQPGTYVQGRGQAVAKAAAPKPSKAATLTYTSTADRYYGFVIVNRMVPPTGALPPAGNYTVTVNLA